MKNKLYLNNLVWSFLDFFSRVIFAFAATIIFAKFLSKSDYGILVYANSILLLALTISRAGMDKIILRDIPLGIKNNQRLLQSGISIIFIFSIFVFIATILFFKITENNLFYFAVISLLILSNPFSIFEYYQRATLLTKYIFISRFISKLFFLVIIFYISYQTKNFIYIAFSYLIENLIFNILLIYFFRKNRKKSILRKFYQNIRNNFDESLKVLKRSFIYIVIGSLSILNLKIQFFIIRYYYSFSELASYDIAYKIPEMINQMLFTIFISLMPFLMASKRKSEHLYILNFRCINLALLIIAFIAVIILFNYGNEIISIFFGKKYQSSIELLKYLSLTIPTSLLWFTSFHFLIFEKNEHLIIYKICIMIILKIFFLILFIPLFDIYGIVPSMILSDLLGIVLFNGMNSKSRKILNIYMNIINYETITSLKKWINQIFYYIKR